MFLVGLNYVWSFKKKIIIIEKTATEKYKTER